jgi:hypothetical protein
MITDEVIVELEEESEESNSDSSEIATMSDPFDPVKIQIQQKTDTLRNIIERLKLDEIDMNSDFQRSSDLWTNAKMSRLLESIFIRFPLPAFYFDASDDDKWLVVDGLQRLSAIRKFVTEKNPKKRLRLSGLEYLTELSGFTYEELPYKRRIDECPLIMFLIMPGTPPEVKYSIFRRINTGGLVLNNQEIRNALAQPKERKYLKKLTENSFFVKALGGKSRRMMDQELVLRFIAFYNYNFTTSKTNIAAFLDEAMARIANSSEKELETIENIFTQSIEICFNIFGKYAFEKLNINGEIKRRRKNASLFEVWMVSIALLAPADRAILIQKKVTVIDKFSLLLDSSDFDRSISIATQKHEHIKIRHESIKDLIQEALHD